MEKNTDIKTSIVPLPAKDYFLMMQEEFARDYIEYVNFFLKHKSYGSWEHIYGISGIYEITKEKEVLVSIDLSDENSKKAVDFFVSDLQSHIITYYRSLNEHAFADKVENLPEDMFNAFCSVGLLMTRILTGY